MTALERARTWLVLGRISNLPTVWSNCVAAWLIAGGGENGAVVALCLGASCLYTAGMFLNDVCDVKFDQKFNPERPIPAGATSRKAVLIAGCALLAVGVALLSAVSLATMFWSIGLAVLIVTYDVAHKWISFAPVLMATCRVLLYPLAGSTSDPRSQSRLLVFGIALGCYVAGLSFFARTERANPGRRSWWPASLMILSAAPAAVVNSGARLIYLAPFLLWIGLAARSIRTATSRAVSMLLAGIILFDLNALAPTSPSIAASFVALFLLTLLLQRYIPAT
jgi:4-hydroxybenzoate polyprenyltransferase